MSTFDRNCDWYCDCCDAHLNKQSGFTAITGTWVCTECGMENDVSEDNILSDFATDIVDRFIYLTCPRCAAHMETHDDVYYECPDCGCEVKYDVYEDSYSILN